MTGQVAGQVGQVEQLAEGMWFEVANVKLGDGQLAIQIRGDRNPDRPRWLPVRDKDDGKMLKVIMDGLDKKRVVLAHLVGDGGDVRVDSITVQYVDAAR